LSPTSGDLAVRIFDESAHPYLHNGARPMGSARLQR
jgi:hypothetical protein